MNARNEKTRCLRSGFFGPLRVSALIDQVTGPKRDPATETPFQSSGIQSHSSSKNPAKYRYQWPSPLALCRICMDWIQEMLPCRCEGRAERGDSANSPNAQRRTAAQIHTQAGMRRQAGRPLNRIRRLSNREGVVSGGGALSERAEGRQEAGNGIQVR